MPVSLLSHSFDSNPYAPPLEEAEASAVPPQPDIIPIRTWNLKWDRILLAVNIAICVIGVPFAMIEIESIIGSGAAIAVGGLLLILRELYMRRRGRPVWLMNVCLGIFGPFVAISLTGVIGGFGWSPQEAIDHGVRHFVVIVGISFTILAIISGCFPPAVLLRHDQAERE